MSLLAKARRCSRAELSALGEALVMVILAAPLLRLMPLRLLARTAGRPIVPLADVARRTDCAILVAWAVDRAAKRSPLRALCFERGLAAHWMLRRRGVDSTLFFGVAPRPLPGRALDAHVWVRAEELDVSGTPDAGSYAVLATFPAGRDALAHHNGGAQPA